MIKNLFWEFVLILLFSFKLVKTFCVLGEFTVVVSQNYFGYYMPVRNQKLVVLVLFSST